MTTLVQSSNPICEHCGNLEVPKHGRVEPWLHAKNAMRLRMRMKLPHPHIVLGKGESCSACGHTRITTFTRNEMYSYAEEYLRRKSPAVYIVKQLEPEQPPLQEKEIKQTRTIWSIVTGN